MNKAILFQLFEIWVFLHYLGITALDFIVFESVHRVRIELIKIKGYYLIKIERDHIIRTLGSFNLFSIEIEPRHQICYREVAGILIFA